jgi:hypothetical protein
MFIMNIQNKIFVWNCRGAANTSFYRYCKQYVVSFKPVMLVIVETRCDPTKLCRTFNLLGYDGFIATEVDGFAGGIVVVSKENYMKVELQCKKFQFIHLKVCYPNGVHWFFTPIYASPNEANRSMLWDDLKGIANNMQTAWMLAGDFNDIASVDEKKGGAMVSIRKCNIDQVLRTKREIMARLAGIQKSMANGNMYGGIRRLEAKLQCELQEILKKEELMWFQRSRAKWLCDGDRNTRYYHIKTVTRRRRNNIIMLRDENGDWVDDAGQLKGMVNNFYKQLFTMEYGGGEWMATEVSFPRLQDDTVMLLGADVTMEEVKKGGFLDESMENTWTRWVSCWILSEIMEYSG